MIDVPEKWINSHKELLLPETFIRLSWSITNPELQGTLSVDCDTPVGRAYYSKPETIIANTIYPFESYATFEPNQWLLDGSKRHIPISDYGDTGFVSNEILTSEELIVKIKLDNLVDKVLPGITIVWYENEYCKRGKIKILKQNSIIKVISFENDEPRMSILEEIIDFDEIHIISEEWCLPNRRVRINKVLLGIERTYEKQDLLEFRHKANFKVLTSHAPENNIHFKLNNLNNEFDTFSDMNQGTTKYLMENQEIKLEYGMKIDNQIKYIQAGRFYLDSWKSTYKGLAAEFTATSILSYLKKEYYKDVYRENPISLYDLAKNILDFANLPLDGEAYNYTIDDKLKNIYTKGFLQPATCIDCLKFITQAGMCNMWIDHQGKLNIKDIEKSEKGTIESFIIQQKPTIKLESIVDEIKVEISEYKENSEVKELAKLGVEEGQNQTLIYRSGIFAKDYVVEINHGNIISTEMYGAYGIIEYNATSPAEIKIKGRPIESKTTEYSKKIKDIDVERKPLDVKNPLIADGEMAENVAEWVESIVVKRRILSIGKWRANPIYETGDVVHITGSGLNEDIILTEISTTFNGAFSGSLKGREL